MSRIVILDTNFLLIPFQFKINIFSELNYLLDFAHYYVISSRTLFELRKISRTVGKDGMAARLALKMVENEKDQITIIESKDFVDNWIFDYAVENNAIVCTNDSGLRHRLRERKMKIITLKNKVKIGYE